MVLYDSRSRCGRLSPIQEVDALAARQGYTSGLNLARCPMSRVAMPSSTRLFPGSSTAYMMVDFCSAKTIILQQQWHSQRRQIPG